MSYSFTSTESRTFTKTHAKYMASKIVTDLKRLQRFYGKPDDSFILQHFLEAVMLLKFNFLKRITYGFQRYEKWIEPTLKYTAHDLMNDYENDDDPGKIRPGKDVSGAVFSSFLEYSNSWKKLSSEEQNEFENQLPFQRSFGTEPLFNGYLYRDLTYSSGGRTIYRESLRSY